MRNTSLVICILLINNCTFAQATANQIEINPYFQWNSYPSFTTPYNSAMNSTIKMKGDNWGVGIFYNYAHKKRIFTKAGVGYYKYGFTDIREYTHLFSRNARDINYPDGSSTFGYVCNKYWYHNITVTIGIEKLFKLRKSNDFIVGLNIANYYTFSQFYNIPGTNDDTKYKEASTRYFGLSTMLYTGLRKKFTKISIGTTVMLPIFTIWKQDVAFPHEQNSNSRSKWLKGIGTGITFTYTLNKKRVQKLQRT